MLAISNLGVDYVWIGYVMYFVVVYDCVTCGKYCVNYYLGIESYVCAVVFILYVCHVEIIRTILYTSKREQYREHIHELLG